MLHTYMNTENQNKMTGLSVSIFKNSEIKVDCTNNGISNNFTGAVIYGPLVKNGPIDYDDHDKAVLYVHEHPRVPGYLIATPSPDPDEQFMMGGNFIHSSDSRFPSKQPIPIHDRIEESERRLQFEEIIVITDQLHHGWRWLNEQESTNEIEELKGKISGQISEIGKKYQDVLNKDQRKRIFEGP